MLFFALGIAAWLDNKERRVPNNFWITWSKPAIFLWTLDLMINNAPWYVYASAAGMVAYASIAVIGRPTSSDILDGNRLDIVVSLWYVIGIVGIIQGITLHGSLGIDVINGVADNEAMLWWSTIAVALPIFLVDFAWRMRLIHGGADSKCLMWVAILIPNWESVPILYPSEPLLSLPPAIALLMWGGAVFIILPFIFIIVNLLRGGGPIKLIWHAYQLDLEEAQNRHVWILTSIVEMPNEGRKIMHKTRAPSRTPSNNEIQKLIEELKENDVDTVWVTPKLPLLAFLWPSVLPLVLIGGPMAYIMPLLGL